MTVLVVGANGQLGARCCAELLARGYDVRGTVRSAERGAELATSGVDIVHVDLTSEGFGSALAGVETVVLTANPAAPRRGDDLEALGRGLHRLLADAADAEVRRVVLVSVPKTAHDGSSLVFRAKRELEDQVRAAPYEHVIVRFPPFMECWLALVGSSLPLRGEPFATIGRPSPFLQTFRKATGSLVEDRGLMLVPGSARIRNAFIAERDVARVCVDAVERDDLAGRTIEVGGPEVLSWTDVAEEFARVLDRRVRILGTPAAVYAAAATLLGPVARVPAATMALNRVMGSSESVWSPGGGEFDATDMITVRQFLDEKARLPAALPQVA